jgi:DNA-binding NarL/FixJ family response regulator
MRNYKKENRDKILAIHRKSRNALYKKNATQRWKDRVNNTVRLAIKNGKLKRLPCEVCGSYAQAHHDSYLPEDRLNVRWLCQVHHAEWHRTNKPKLPSLKKIAALTSQYLSQKKRGKRVTKRVEIVKKLLAKGYSRKRISKLLCVSLWSVDVYHSKSRTASR